MTRILSFGGGVNSTALLLLLEQTDFRQGEVVFADTGVEWPETYDYMEKYSIPYCESHDIKFTTVKANLEKLGTTSLEEFCLVRKMTPSRIHRWCTDKFKIRPIRRYVKETYGKAVCLMGIDYGEVHRIHQPHYSEIRSEYPLVDWKITRTMCKRVIRTHGWPVPQKSGCFLCPFQRLSEWQRLYLNHPDLYERVEQIEQVDRYFPKYCLAGQKPLSELKVRFGDGFAKIQHTEEQPCDNGWCNT